MRLGALVIDLALLGQHAWEYLERVASELPALPIVVCTGQSTVAQRVRGLRLGADDWIDEALPSRGADRAHRGRLAAPAPGRRHRHATIRCSRARSRCAPISSRPSRMAARSTSRGASSSSSRCWRAPTGACSSARRSTSACGATRWPTATARSTSSCASCAPSCRGVAGLELHPHALRRRLPLCGAAGGRACRCVGRGCRARRRAPVAAAVPAVAVRRGRAAARLRPTRLASTRWPNWLAALLRRAGAACARAPAPRVVRVSRGGRRWCAVAARARGRWCASPRARGALALCASPRRARGRRWRVH